MEKISDLLLEAQKKFNQEFNGYYARRHPKHGSLSVCCFGACLLLLNKTTITELLDETTWDKIDQLVKEVFSLSISQDMLVKIQKNFKLTNYRDFSSKPKIFNIRNKDITTLFQVVYHLSETLFWPFEDVAKVVKFIEDLHEVNNNEKTNA